MNGKTDEEIMAERNHAIELIKREHPDAEIVDSLVYDQLEEKHGGLRHLAKSLDMLDAADAIYMMPGWEKARGCKIEHECAVAYNIAVLYLKCIQEIRKQSDKARRKQMTKEELEALGLTAEQITGVQGLNTKEVNAAKQQAETERDGYKSQLDTATTELAKFKDVDPAKLNEQIASLNQQLADQKAKYEKKIADRDFNDSVSSAITSAGGINAKTILPLLDLKALRESKNQKTDIAAAVEAVKKENAYLFKESADEPIRKPVTETGGNGGGGAISKDYMARMRAAMGLPPKKD